MSHEIDDDQLGERTTAEDSASPAPLEQLMRRRSADAGGPNDREDDAQPGAGQVAAGDAAATTAEAVLAQESPADQRTLIVVRVLLVLNLAFLVALLVLPSPAGRGRLQPEQPSQPTPPEPVPSAGGGGGATRTTPEGTNAGPSLGLPKDALYEQALVLALEGRFDAAAQRLESYLVAYPDMNPAVRRLVFDHIAYYLRKAGRLDDALRYENRSRALVGSVLLPDELLRAAHEAEQQGDGVAMRQAYARFLLQQDQVSPALRAKIVESYLRLGDAYRVEADEAEDAERRPPKPRREKR